MPPTDNLATMPGFAKMNGVAVDSEGRADPQTQLFRSTAYGVQTGPFVSQVWMKAMVDMGGGSLVLSTPIFKVANRVTPRSPGLGLRYLVCVDACYDRSEPLFCPILPLTFGG